MKEAYYFSHDSNARNDGRILKLRMKHGMRGYGIFWAIIEMLRDESDYRMRIECDRIAFELHEDSEIVSDVIKSFGLFIIKDGYFWSDSLLRRMKLRQEKSNKARESALKRWNKDTKSHMDANVMRTHSESNARKGKESKVNRKENNIPPLSDFEKPISFDEPQDSERCRKAINLIAAFFNLSEIRTQRNYMLVGNFVRYLEGKNRLDELADQFTSYRKIKEKEPKFKHNFQNYIGTPEESYEDGIWCSKDWTKALNESEKTGDAPAKLSYSIQDKIKQGEKRRETA